MFGWRQISTKRIYKSKIVHQGCIGRIPSLYLPSIRTLDDIANLNLVMAFFQNGNITPKFIWRVANQGFEEAFALISAYTTTQIMLATTASVLRHDSGRCVSWTPGARSSNSLLMISVVSGRSRPSPKLRVTSVDCLRVLVQPGH